MVCIYPYWITVMEDTVIINRIVEAEMTADEQVELMRLEDEVSMARDEVEWVDLDRSYSQYVDARNILHHCEQNLTNYIDSITKKVMERIQSTDV